MVVSIHCMLHINRLAGDYSNMHTMVIPELQGYVKISLRYRCIERYKRKVTESQVT